MLYQKFKNNLDLISHSLALSNIALAVSGGSDSVALLILADKLAKERGCNLTIININHNLRHESKEEAEYVDYLSESLGHVCYKLNWKAQGSFSQEKARNGRYELMTNLCNKLNISTILTAHHQDDYIENFLLKKKRKAGILGLSSCHINFINNVRILRPFFNITKSDLVAYLLENNIKWFEDESNNSDKYDRNRIRKFINIQGQDFRNKILLEQIEIDQKAENLRKEFIDAIARCSFIYKQGFGILGLQNLQNFEKEIQLNVISFILTMISGNQDLPKAKSTELLLAHSRAPNDYIHTLHDCVVKKIADKLVIYKEFGKKYPKDIIAHKGNIWDNRFRLDNDLNLSDAYITRLAIEDYSEIKDFIDLKELKDLSMNSHREILFTLPIVKIMKKIIALGTISYYNRMDLKEVDFTFRPNFISRFTHFC